MVRLASLMLAVLLALSSFALAQLKAPLPTPKPTYAPAAQAKAAVDAVNAAKTDAALIEAVAHLKEVYHPTTVKAALALVMDEKKPIKARIAAAEALGKYRDASVAAELTAYVFGVNVKKQVDLSVPIISALGQIASPVSIPALYKLADYKDIPVAVASVNALGKIKDKAVVEPLIKILDKTENADSDSASIQRRYSEVSVAARAALISITKQSFSTARDYRQWWKVNQAGFSFEPEKPKPTPSPR